MDGGVGTQQMTLDGRTGVPIRPAAAVVVAPTVVETASKEMMEGQEVDVVRNGDNEANGERRGNVGNGDNAPIDVPAPEGPRDGLVFEHYKPNGERVSSSSRIPAGEEEDVEMG